MIKNLDVIEVCGYTINPFIGENGYVCAGIKNTENSNVNIEVVGDRLLGTDTYMSRDRSSLKILTDVLEITVSKYFINEAGEETIKVDVKLRMYKN